MKKCISVLAALAAFSLVSFGFVACSDDDDSSDNDALVLASIAAANAQTSTAEVVVVFSGGEEDKESFTFYADNTWSWVWDETLKVFGGTYTGNPTVDGTVNLKITYVTDEEFAPDDDDDDNEPMSDEMKAKLRNNFPLRGLITENGTKLTVKWSDNASTDDVFTR